MSHVIQITNLFLTQNKMIQYILAVFVLSNASDKKSILVYTLLHSIYIERNSHKITIQNSSSEETRARSMSQELIVIEICGRN